MPGASLRQHFARICRPLLQVFESTRFIIKDVSSWLHLNEPCHGLRLAEIFHVHRL